jgi:hypothetical protein
MMMMMMMIMTMIYHIVHTEGSRICKNTGYNTILYFLYRMNTIQRIKIELISVS